MIEDPELCQPLVPIAARLAYEGVPVRAIARSFDMPAEVIRAALDVAKANGTISAVPRDDWPPTARYADHLPSAMAKESEKELLLIVAQVFKLTKLQSHFMLVLLKRDAVDKETFHFIIEQQRAIRRNRPDNPDPTDPKMVDVVIWNIRKRLKRLSLTIDTLWGHGYFMPSDDRHKANEMVATAMEIK